MKIRLFNFTKNTVLKLFVLAFVLISVDIKSQCMPTVPSFTINLTGQPAGIWSSPNVSRNDQCCSATSPDQCIYFNLTLDPNSAGIQIDMIGADPAGSLFYDIGCTGNYPGGQIKCISGVGPHEITFCKPGGNKNVYKITSISKPLFPADDTVRIGCKKKLVTLGIVNNTTTWTAVNSSSGSAPALLTTINGYLDSLNVASPTYSPATGAPNWVEYQVCGFPIASGCGFSLTVCDIVRVYNYPKLTAGVTPTLATYCSPATGVVLTGTASGGLAPYTYSWTQTPSTVVLGTGNTFTASGNGLFNLIVADKLYDPNNCPAFYASRSVSQGTIPVAIAPPSKKVCASTPSAALSGTVQYQTSMFWSGGNGSYIPSSNVPNITYSPSAAEVAVGSVKLYINAIGGNGCSNKKDSLWLYFSPTLTTSISSGTLACHNSITTLTANVSGGTMPYSYLWNTSATTNTILAGQGNYNVMVNDSLGCAGNANLNVVAPTALSMIFNVSNVTINGGNDGSATVTPSGGAPAYSVTWTPGGMNTMAINTLTYGVYTAKIVDANGCELEASTIVNEPRCLLFTSAVSATNVNCYGGTNGSASVSVSGGSPAYTYTWNTSPTQNTPLATNLPAGVYSCFIEDSNVPACFQTANVTVTEPTELTTIISHTDVATVNPGNDGAAAVNAFGGSLPYSYLWNTFATTSVITNLAPGSYSVQVTDQKGCNKFDNVYINSADCNELNLNLVSNNVTCFGGNNGSALAVVTGATGSYTVSWSNGDFGPSTTNLTSGAYSVVVTDSKGCSEFINFSITQPSQLSIGLLPTNISCNGLNDGSIDVTVSGGNIPYNITWSEGSASEDLTNLGPGTYSVVITDANGCQAIASAIITQPQPLTATYSVQNVTCYNGTNGAINLNANGGVTPYTYTWSTSATTSSISNLPAGGYTVNVKDANNCTFTQPLIIGISQPDSVKVASYTISCPVPGSGSTQVVVTPTGGISGMFQVSFDNGSNYQPAGNYSALLANNATYSIALKDANNCTSLSSFTINVLPEVSISTLAFSKCYTVGTTSTSIVVTPAGGDGGPYEISYDNGGSFQSAGNYTYNASIANSYTILARDTRSCVSTNTIINLPSVFDATTIVTSNYNGQNISCFGLSDGSASVAVSGGSGSYTYTWSTTPTQSTSAASNLNANTFTVSISDGNSCLISKTVTLTEPSAISATAGVSSNYNGQDISCAGLSDGSATVAASGATSPYSYQWNSIPSQTTATASNLSAGTYSVVVKDVNNCAITKTVVLVQPAGITATTAVTSNYNGQDISCFGLSDGSASVTTSGGTGIYSYTWSTTPAQNTASASTLSAGIYSVTIADVNGCAVTKTVTLSQPTQIAATTSITSNYNGQNISCFGLSDGSASVSTSGGTGAYSYTWSTTPAQNTANASTLSAGIYSVTVADVNGCAVTKTANLTEPTAVTSTAGVSSNYNGQNISCFGLSDGSATVAANGGTGAYSYTWTSAPTQSTSTASNLSAGTYSIIVSDVNGCSVTQTVTLTEPSAISATTGVSSNYNGQDISCAGLSDGSATVTASGATSPYSYQWNSIPSQTTATASNLSAGTYSVVVKDVNNCAITKTVVLVSPAGITATTAVTSNYNGQDISCNGLSDGSVQVTASNGTSPYTYTWSATPIQTTSLASGLPAGTYSVIITDVNGCNITKTISLSEPAAIVATTTVTSNYNGQDISCFGLSDGSASVSVIGGTTPYTYTWSTTPNQTTTAASNLASGIYTVDVTDINGCAATQTIELSDPNQLLATLTSTSNYNGYNVSCFGSSNGFIDISVNGGTGAYTYTWSNTSNNQDINNLTAGNYSVVVSDINGCTDTLNLTLIEPNQLTAVIDSISNFNGYNVSCYGSTNGTVFISVNGGVTNYNYEWSNGSTNQDLNDVGLGYYYLLVIDSNNCKVSIDTTLNQPPKISGTYTITQPTCNSIPDGSVDLEVSGGVIPFAYNWSNGDTTQDLSGAAAGMYTVTYTDANGCKDSSQINIFQPQSIAVVKEVDKVKCFKDTSGSIITNITGGTLPYKFNWSNGDTTQNLTSIGSGTYILIAFDDNGCMVTDTTIVDQPDSLYLNLYSPTYTGGYNISKYNGDDGSIDLTVTGGTPPYSYQWSNGSTNEDLFNLTAYFPNPYPYSVVVTDSNGCRVSGKIELKQPLILEMPTAYSPNGDGKNDYFVVKGIEVFPDNKITIFNRWGNIVYTKTQYNNEWDGNSQGGEALFDGTYFVILEIDKGTKTEKILKNYVELRRY